MGLVFCGMLWVLLFHRFYQITLLLLSKWRKNNQNLGGAHEQTKSPDISL